MPCKTCDSPYHPFRFSMRSISLGMSAPQISFDHQRVAGYSLVISMIQYLAALQHGDRVGNIGNHLHVMFDHQDGAAHADLLDQLFDAVDVFMSHALGR